MCFVVDPSQHWAPPALVQETSRLGAFVNDSGCFRDCQTQIINTSVLLRLDESAQWKSAKDRTPFKSV